MSHRAAVFAAVRAERFPRTAAVAPTMARYITTDRYLWGLDRLLDGIYSGTGTPSA